MSWVHWSLCHQTWTQWQCVLLVLRYARTANTFLPCHFLFTFQEEGTQILSFDALFGLCRKKHSGLSVRPPLYRTTFFENQGEVDRFVQEYDCSSSLSDKVSWNEDAFQYNCVYIHYRVAISFWLEIVSGQKNALLLSIKLLFLEVYAGMNSLCGSLT